MVDFCKASLLVGVLFVIACSQVNAGHNFTYTGEPVMCYECNSHPKEEGKDCEDPINMDKISKVECPSGLCLKYVQNIENDIKQINRGCAAEIEPVLKDKGDEEGCVLSTGTKMIQICNCVKDSCNGVSRMTSATAVILLVFVAKFFH